MEVAIDWYESRAVGLANRFRAAVNRSLDEIERYPSLNPAAFGDSDIRFRRVGSFPYLLLYRIKSGFVEILRIVHSASDPEKWRSAID
jgi:plasmid stabilization system protein ParE